MKTANDFRSLSSEAQEQVRFKAVAAVKSGRTQGEVATLFGVTRQAVCNWMRLRRRSGMQGLRARPRGRPVGGRLQPRQERLVQAALRDHCPDQLKLPFYLWTREAVGQLIARRCGVRVSVWTVGRYLARWGFTAQKPTRQAFERDPRQVRRWLHEQYPAIRVLARRLRAQIFWADETGMRSDHTAGRSFSPRGVTPVILGTGQRFRCNMISAITNRGQLHFMVFRCGFTVPVFRNFLRRLLRQCPGMLILIIDRHPVHMSQTIQAWIARHHTRLRVFFLPGYSPELNPDEYLNHDVKANAVGRARPTTSAELIGNVRSYLRITQARPALVKRYFHPEPVRYALV